MKIELYDDGIGSVELVSSMGTAKTVVNAARVSFGNDDANAPFDEKDKKLVSYLWKHRHTSPFEHLLITFKCVVPIFVARQHMRHRVWKFNELSRRYSSGNIQFYLPKIFRKQHEKNRQASTNEEFDPILESYERESPESTFGYQYSASEIFQSHCENSLELYEKMINHGICKEQARMVLPVNLYTEYYGTIDLHNLLKFIELRSHEGAQKEIVLLADAMKSISQSLWPEIFEAIK